MSETNGNGSNLEMFMEASNKADLGTKRLALAAAMKVLGGEVSEPKYLTTGQVAEKLDLHRGTIWRWHLPSHNGAGDERHDNRECAAYLDSENLEQLRERLHASSGARSRMLSRVSAVPAKPAQF